MLGFAKYDDNFNGHKTTKRNLGQMPIFNRLSKIFQNTTFHAPPAGERREILFKLSGKPEVPGQAPRMRVSIQLELPILGDPV